MPSVNEGQSTPLNSALTAGIDSLSQAQEITFYPYVRVVLPLDGFVFYVAPALLSRSAIVNAFALNETAPNDFDVIVSETLQPLTAKGSLHYATDLMQELDQTLAINHVIFTSESSVRNLDDINPALLYIGEFDGLQFAFSRRGSFYQQAGIYHYRGDAINGAMAAQIINDAADFDTHSLVVSNSLPIWLSLNSLFPVFPSFLVPPNELAPYAAVHIDPNSTEALQMAPAFYQLNNDDNTTSTIHAQLVKERVKFTIYGERNANALNFQDMIFQYSLSGDTVGIMNMPVIRDEKRTQPELAAIGMKKSFELEVNYNQSSIVTLAREFITSCVPTYFVE